MHSFEYILIILGGVLISSVVSQRLSKISTPLVQIGLGVIIYFIPFINIELNIDPSIFLLLFIAPLLFDDAKRADKPALLKLIKPILSLSVVLVVATTLFVGFSFNIIMGTGTLALAFAMAAALAPTDAVSVSSLEESSSIGLSRRLLLQGESLLNDAASIVAYSFAITYITHGTFSEIIPGSNLVLVFLGDLALKFVGGIAVGLVFTLVRNVLVRWLRSSGFESITFHVLLEIMTPFLVFIFAEALHVSGIIAAVVAGVLYSYSNKAASPEHAKTTLVSGSVWTVLSFTLNGLIFLMLGTELPRIMISVWQDGEFSVWQILFMLAMVLLIYIMRFLWILWMRRRANLATCDVNDSEAGDANNTRGRGELDQGEMTTVQMLEQEAGYSENEAISAVMEERSYTFGEGDFRMDSAKGKFSRDELKRMLAEKKQYIKQQMIESYKNERGHPKYWAMHLYDAFLLTICGVKGAITLALMLTLPMSIVNRDSLLLIASGTIIVSLLIANFVVPLVAPAKRAEILPESELKETISIYRSVRHKILQNMLPGNRLASEHVARTYDHRVAHIKSINDLSDDNEDRVRMRLLTQQRDYTLSLIKEGKVKSMVGTFWMLQLSRQMTHLSPTRKMYWTLIAMVKQYWNHILQFIAWFRETGSTKNEDKRQDFYNEVRALQKDNLRFALRQLDTIMNEPDAPIKAINSIMSDIKRRIERLENTHRNPLRSGTVPDAVRPVMEADASLSHVVTPGAGNFDKQVLEIENDAIQFEREAISNALEHGKITAKTAKHLRDTANLMELDIEDHLE